MLKKLKNFFTKLVLYLQVLKNGMNIPKKMLVIKMDIGNMLLEMESLQEI